jgi:predicted CopG family antitoxin
MQTSHTKYSNIRVRIEVKRDLDVLGKKNQSYSDLLANLLKERKN